MLLKSSANQLLYFVSNSIGLCFFLRFGGETNDVSRGWLLVYLSEKNSVNFDFESLGELRGANLGAF